MTARRRLLALLVLGILAIATMGQDDSCAGEDVNQPLNEQSDSEGDDEGSGGEEADEAEEEEPAADFEPIEQDGNGSQNLPPIEVPSDGTLSWTNEDDEAFRQFLLYDEAFGVNVTSDAEEGETFVPEGTYRFTVSGGDWSFTIEPGAE